MDSHIASFYFRILISESRVSDSSCLGKAGLAPGFVVLSDTVFRNNSQQGGPERGLRCHGRWCHMSTRFSVFHRISTVEMKYDPLWHSEVISGCCLYLKSRCYFANPKSPFSSPTSLLRVSHIWWADMYCICELVLYILGSSTYKFRKWECWVLSLCSVSWVSPCS